MCNVQDEVEMSDYEYFSNCPIYVFERHKTVEEARERAEELIQDHLKADGSWSEFVEQVCWGKIEETATQINVQPDKTGRFDHICEYELKQPD